MGERGLDQRLRWVSGSHQGGRQVSGSCLLQQRQPQDFFCVPPSHGTLGPRSCVISHAGPLVLNNSAMKIEMHIFL